MINDIHKTYLKGEKAFEKGEFVTAKKHLLSVVNYDSNYYAAYLLLFEIADKNNSSLKKIVFEELKRLNPSLNIKYKAPKSNRKFYSYNTLYQIIGPTRKNFTSKKKLKNNFRYYKK